MTRWGHVAWVFGLLLSGKVMALPAEVTLASDQWCPYNCDANSSSPGILIELAREAWQPLGVKVNYEIMPWARAKMLATQKGSIGLVGAGRGLDENVFVYGKVPPLVSPFCFYTAINSRWNYSGLGALSSIRLGTALGYHYDGEVGQYVENRIKQESNLVQPALGDTPILVNMDKLAGGRIDALLEDRLVVQHTIYRNALKVQTRESGCITADDTIYVVLPKQIGQSAILMDQFDKTVVAMRKDGRFQKLLAKYGVTVKGY
ncbi:substrate-binding periplasmic protein [Leeia oryzae]|uniref:substrate-binding periplasmic protein n=1 Tax=Leeia oryzae TaxID=356662 RepID=UPI000477B810|nr:transporter substrate-binding domain-containing protein [Leeia oryzae]